MVRSTLVGVATAILGLVTMAGLAAIRNYRNHKGFDFSSQVQRLLQAGGLGEVLTLAGVLAVAGMAALLAAAALVARHHAGISPPAPAYNS